MIIFDISPSCNIFTILDGNTLLKFFHFDNFKIFNEFLF